MGKRIDPELTRRARELRDNPTPAERLIWQRISRYRPAFTRQLIVAPFILDLACREAKLGVEFDGSQHLADAVADARRTRPSRSARMEIMRSWNSEVESNPDGTALQLLAGAAECLGGTHPQPLPSREGRPWRPRSR